MTERKLGIQPEKSPASPECGTRMPTKRPPPLSASLASSVQPLPSLQRDCQPHRGRLMRTLGVCSLAIGGLAMAFFPLSLVALPLCLTTWIWARLDLAKIRGGLMDPCGERLTYEAHNDAVAGLVLSFTGVFIWGAIVFCMLPGR